MADQQVMRINLSLVSHTNIGKTTLARTLLGRDIGEVADRPHVTETNDDYVLIRATDGCSELVLWDTPGFGDSVRLAARIEGRANPVGWFLSEVWDRMSNKALWLNQRALKHVRDTSSVVLYLVNASESPKACSYIAAEMKILNWIGKPIIVLLNQMGKPREQEVEAAELQAWTDYMRDYPLVKTVLPMDAFARCWVQEFALFEAIGNVLTDEQRVTFDALRDAWSRQRRAIYSTSIDALSSYLTQLALDHEELSNYSLTEQVKDWGRKLGVVKLQSGPIEDAKNALAARAADSLVALTQRLIDAHQLEGSGVKREILRRLKTDWTVHSAANPKGAALVGAVGAGAASGIAADVATGGLSLGLGTLLGTVIGAIGGAGAALAYNQVKGVHGTRVSWSKMALQNFLLEAVLLYLAVAHFGRGRGYWEESEAPAFWKDLVIAEIGKQPKDFDPTTLTDPDQIESLNKTTTDSVIRGVLYALYKRAP